MEGRLCFGVLAAFLLFFVAVGVCGATTVRGIRVVMGQKGDEGSEISQLGHEAPPAGDGRSIPSPVPKGSTPPTAPSRSKPSTSTPPNPSAAPQKESPLTPPPKIVSNPPPAVQNSPAPVSHPPPSGSPPGKSSASDGGLNPPPVSPKHSAPPPPEPKLSSPGPIVNGGAPRNGEDGKHQEKKRQPGSPNNASGSPEKDKITERCNVSPPVRCQTEGFLACLRQIKDGVPKWYIVLQNKGDNRLNVTISGTSHLKFEKNVTSVPPRGETKINIQMDAVEDQSIVLRPSTGTGTPCTIKVPQQSPGGNFFQQFPNYASRVTPIHGVYLASLTIIFVGATWACCRFRRKRRVDSGVAYQQLEMSAQQQSSNALDDEDVVDGWDNDWNDGWDEEEGAPRPSERREEASQINGAASKFPDKNEWEDWDD